MAKQSDILLHYLLFLCRVRRLRKAVLSVISLVTFLTLLWYLQSSKKPQATSAIPCKGKIVNLVFSSNLEEVEKYIPTGNHDVEGKEREYFHLLNQIEHQCHYQRSYGKHTENSWMVCLDAVYELQKPCLVYSFGVGFDFNFEEDIAENEGCEVHAFDPSMGISSYQHAPNIYFHDWGIASHNGLSIKSHWSLQTLSRTMEQLGHNEAIIDILKLDVEFSEWPALYQMLKAGTLRQVKQLAVEFHTPEMDSIELPNHVCSTSNSRFFDFALRILLELHNTGFRIFYFQPNYRVQYRSGFTGENRYCCVNVNFVNINIK